MAHRACLNVSAGVRAALQHGRPVVALESTIITHGLPRPINYETALAVEDAVRKAGAEPATIALLDGMAHVGLTTTQLARISDSRDRVFKASRANLAQVLAKGKGHVGGTTVSGTMALAHLAGIRVFATGGIGGVHRGAESSMDVSADLIELGRTPVAVFSSGIKSILDIPRTLEYLETQGVPVMTFNSSGELPNFYSAHSGQFVPSVSGVQEAARIMAYNAALNLQNGMLFGVPIPSEFESEGTAIQDAVEMAVKESVELGIDRQGKLVTPWLLKRVAELAQQSVKSNVGLVLNNARVAAECAAALAQQAADAPLENACPVETPHTPCDVLVFGCAAVDITAQRTSEPAPLSTARGHVHVSIGGVGQNMARAAQYLATRPNSVVLVAPINARDALGAYLQDALQRDGLRQDALVHSTHGQTPACNLLLDEQGDLETGIAGMGLVEKALTPTAVEHVFRRWATHRLAVVGADANMTPAALAHLARLCAQHNVPWLFEPTSSAKATRLVDALLHEPYQAQFATPNGIELACMASRLRREGVRETPTPVPETLAACLPATAHQLVRDASVVSRLANVLFVKLGEHGVLLVHRVSDALRTAHSSACVRDATHLLNTTGAGDTFTGAILAAISALPRLGAVPTWDFNLLQQLVEHGQRAASHTLSSPEAVPASLARRK